MILALFWAFSGVAILAALLCITRRSPVASVLWLVVTLFALAGDFVLLDAQFIAVLQVLVYAGAIMVLFLFVIMLLNLQHDPGELRWRGRQIAAVVMSSLFVLGMIHLLWSAGSPEDAGMAAAAPKSFGTTAALSERLFTHYLLPFEITSLLLLVAVIGAVVLAKKRLD